MVRELAELLPLDVGVSGAHVTTSATIVLLIGRLVAKPFCFCGLSSLAKHGVKFSLSNEVVGNRNSWRSLSMVIPVSVSATE